MLLFTADDHERVARGEVTVTWRLWKYSHVKAGGVYSTGFGFVAIEDVRHVRVFDVTDADAHEVGLDAAAALVDLARSHSGAKVAPDSILYRVQFRHLGESDPRPPRPLPSLEQVTDRLARLDHTSPRGPWTLQALRLIEEHPREAARLLAAELRWDTAAFKVHVRKLKALGLTESCEVGYELSELGQSYVDTRLDRESDVGTSDEADTVVEPGSRGREPPS
jgi:hypothetical protein